VTSLFRLVLGRRSLNLVLIRTRQNFVNSRATGNANYLLPAHQSFFTGATAAAAASTATGEANVVSLYTSTVAR